jgi:putative FmdB family regulatory protein
MPTYEYVCASCGSDFDVFQSMSDAPLKVCPTCGNAVKRKINGGTGIIFKGSGFYKTDSRKSSSAPRGAANSESAGGAASTPAPAPAAAAAAASSSGCESSSGSSPSVSPAPKKDAT